MKIQLKLAALALLLSTLNPQLSTVFAQGSLTPPGAPAATMKSLAQIEPRTPISSAPYTITNSGSYYLTTNLTTAVSNAITIAASGVTLDLSGFTISSTVANSTNGGCAILLGGGLMDITICNGHIRGGVTNNGGAVYSGSGFANGIYCFSIHPHNVRVTGVSVSGCLYWGIQLTRTYSTIVESCTVRTGSRGIEASLVRNSVADDCGNTAIYGRVVVDSWGTAMSSGHGVFASNAQNCQGYGYGGASGLYATMATGCYGYSLSGTGLAAEYANFCSGSSVSVVHKYNMP